jgi:hypothetical protein
LYDPSFYNDEGVKCGEGLVDSSLFDNENFDNFVHINKHDRNMKCVYFKGDPIYDIDHESGIDMLEIESYEETHLGSFSEEVDDPNIEENEVEWLLHDLLGPLDFSGIQGYPNDFQNWRGKLPRFHGLCDSPNSHISSFSDVILKLNINHKYVYMKMLLLSLDFFYDEKMDFYMENLMKERSRHFRISSRYLLRVGILFMTRLNIKGLAWMLSVP